MIRRGIYDYFFLFVLAYVFYGLIKLMSPFAGSLVAALLCAVTFYPVYAKLHGWFPKLSSSVRAALTTILVFIFFVAPVVLLIWAVGQESNSLIPVLKQGSTTVAQLREGNVTQTLPWMERVRYFLSNAFGIKRAQFQESIVANVNRALEYISMSGSLLAGHAIQFLWDLLIMLFGLFFMFRDGERLTSYLMALIPMRRQDKDQLRSKIHQTVIGIVRGLLFTSFIQGVAAAIGYLIVGVNGAILLGAITAVIGLLPVVGTFAIWAPTGIFFLINGSYGKGIFILAWGTLVVVGFIDTVLRPYLVGKKAELPLFALFFAFLGGAEIWGAKGIVLGPLLVALVPALLHIYRERYLRQDDALEVGVVQEPRSVAKVVV